MIILDTNVVSEFMELVPNPHVERWLSNQHVDELFVSAITVAELLVGVEELGGGRRRDSLEARVRRILSMFGPIIVPFDEAAAEFYAAIVAKRSGMDSFDVQIAAIALAHGASVATRNIKHFQHCGVELIDPWAA